MEKDITIVLAPDSFKESMTAKEVCEAMERGIKKINPNIVCIQVPMADGGEGTMQALVDATEGTIYTIPVIDPLGNKIMAQYGILGDGVTGILEMASASGLELVPLHKRNPMVTTTYGTGQLIRACLERGVKKIIIGIGGSATNDGGAGLIQALGGRLLDHNGDELGYGGGELGNLAKIELQNLDSRIKDVAIEVACDVDNPLCGPRGASCVYGPQKGATKDMIPVLDANLAHFASILLEQLGKDVLEVPGSGAAGGLGAGLLAFFNGTLKKGIDIVMDYTNLEEKIKDADMVWTGEGSIDSQTLNGKTPLGVATLAKKYNKPVIALAGRIGDNLDSVYGQGLDAIFCILKGVTSLEEALIKGRENVEFTSENIVRLMKL